MTHQDATFKVGLWTVLITIGLVAALAWTVHATSSPHFCGLCHEMQDPYFQEWQGSAHGEGAECVDCHVGKGLAPLLRAKTTRSFHDLYAHFITGFERPIRQTHPVQDRACLDCHPEGRSLPDASLEVRHDRHAEEGVPCVECHQKTAHAPAAQAAALARDPASCEICHQAHADFPLSGGHASLACADCHREVGYRAVDPACETCHLQDDAHNGQFGADCGACHTPVGWEQVTFDHSLTNFPLEGKHARVECESCHQGGASKELDTACSTCHLQDDAHNGQFGADCGACHTPVGWEQVTFDHSKSGFPLDGAHASVDCKQCHISGYKGTPSQCVSCHQEPTYHLGLFGSDCAACHTTQAWSPAQYHEPHTFPINHGESGWNSCRLCHPDSLQTYTCYNCHEHSPARIEQKHREEGITNFQNCMECHPTGREEEGGD